MPDIINAPIEAEAEMDETFDAIWHAGAVTMRAAICRRLVDLAKLADNPQAAIRLATCAKVALEEPIPAAPREGGAKCGPIAG